MHSATAITHSRGVSPDCLWWVVDNAGRFAGDSKQMFLTSSKKPFCKKPQLPPSHWLWLLVHGQPLHLWPEGKNKPHQNSSLPVPTNHSMLHATHLISLFYRELYFWGENTKETPSLVHTKGLGYNWNSSENLHSTHLKLGTQKAANAVPISKLELKWLVYLEAYTEYKAKVSVDCGLFPLHHLGSFAVPLAR